MFAYEALFHIQIFICSWYRVLLGDVQCDWPLVLSELGQSTLVFVLQHPVLGLLHSARHREHCVILICDMPLLLECKPHEARD